MRSRGDDVQRRALDHLAVDRDAAGRDHPLGLAARWRRRRGPAPWRCARRSHARGIARPTPRGGKAAWIPPRGAASRHGMRFDSHMRMRRSPRRAPPARAARCRWAPSWSARGAHRRPRPATARASSPTPPPMPRCWRSAQACAALGSERLTGLRPLRHAGALRDVRRGDRGRAGRAALLRRGRPQVGRRGARGAGLRPSAGAPRPRGL